jgi:hypothetical protein
VSENAPLEDGFGEGVASRWPRIDHGDRRGVLKVERVLFECRMIHRRTKGVELMCFSGTFMPYIPISRLCSRPY